MNLKSWVRTNLTPIYKVLRMAKSYACRNQKKEIRKSYGLANPDKTFYVIRNDVKGIGLMAYYLSAIGRVEYALQNNYIPVVDMCNYPNPYLEDDLVGKVNSWEFYFKQVSEYTLDEVYNSKNVILSELGTSETGSPRKMYAELSITPQKYWGITGEILRLNSKVNRLLDITQKELFPKGERILGVSTRGTDMVNFPGHSIIPTRKQIMDDVIAIMKKFDYEYIFLATEEQAMIDVFKKKMGDKCIVDSRKRYDCFDRNKSNVLVDVSFDRENDKRLKGQEYLITVGLLSRCDSIAGMLIGSTMGAICMNCGKYEHVEILDYGTY